MIKLTVLGSGTCVPHRKRGSSGYLLRTDACVAVLDCGNGTLWKLEQVGADYLETDCVFITHFHPDHTSDLVPLLFATKYPYGKKRGKPLTIWGPDGFCDFMSNLQKPYGNWVKAELVEFREAGKKKWETCGITIKTFKTFHTQNSIGYSICVGGKKIVYTGDTGYFPGLCREAEEADLFITECAVTDQEKIKVHMTPRNIAEILRRSSPAKILLSHLYPSMDEINLPEEIKALCGNTKTEIITAQDLMEILI